MANVLTVLTLAFKGSRLGLGYLVWAKVAGMGYGGVMVLGGWCGSGQDGLK